MQLDQEGFVEFDIGIARDVDRDGHFRNAGVECQRAGGQHSADEIGGVQARQRRLDTPADAAVARQIAAAGDCKREAGGVAAVTLVFDRGQILALDGDRGQRRQGRHAQVVSGGGRTLGVDSRQVGAGGQAVEGDDFIRRAAVGRIGDEAAAAGEQLDVGVAAHAGHQQADVALLGQAEAEIVVAVGAADELDDFLRHHAKNSAVGARRSRNQGDRVRAAVVGQAVVVADDSAGVGDRGDVGVGDRGDVDREGLVAFTCLRVAGHVDRELHRADAGGENRDAGGSDKVGRGGGCRATARHVPAHRRGRSQHAASYKVEDEGRRTGIALGAIRRGGENVDVRRRIRRRGLDVEFVVGVAGIALDLDVVGALGQQVATVEEDQVVQRAGVVRLADDVAAAVEHAQVGVGGEVAEMHLDCRGSGWGDVESVEVVCVGQADEIVAVLGSKTTVVGKQRNHAGRAVGGKVGNVVVEDGPVRREMGDGHRIAVGIEGIAERDGEILVGLLGFVAGDRDRQEAHRFPFEEHDRACGCRADEVIECCRSRGQLPVNHRAGLAGAHAVDGENERRASRIALVLARIHGRDREAGGVVVEDVDRDTGLRTEYRRRSAVDRIDQRNAENFSGGAFVDVVALEVDGEIAYCLAGVEKDSTRGRTDNVVGRDCAAEVPVYRACQVGRSGAGYVEEDLMHQRDVIDNIAVALFDCVAVAFQAVGRGGGHGALARDLDVPANVPRA